jgi:dipeptidyl aminopeptidase/acylaminoacyl peptidase
MKRLSSPAISPEGQRVVFSVQEWSIEKNESASSLWVVEIAGGAPRRLTTVPGSDGSPAWSPDGTRIAFVSKRAGDEVPSLYVIPADGVQLVHGGAHTMCRDSWSYRWNTHCFAAPGYVVTWVNRHGSTGFGERFSQSILNQWGDMPFEDIMKSTDYLLARFPNLDPERMAAAGASYGGYMATWVLGHTDRFKAIINHAGVNNSYAQYGTDAPHGFPLVMGGKPWENLEGMQRQNPMFYAKNFRTPTLVIHGELDYRVPYGNATELYGVLQAMGVPSRLVIYPNENHWILTPQNALHWHWEMQSWLSRYLGGKPVFDEPRFDSWAS